MRAFLLLAVASCAAHAGAAPAERAPAASRSPGEVMTKQMVDALSRGDLARAEAVVEAARKAPPGKRPSAELVAYWDAAVHTNREDWAGGAAVLSTYLAGVPQSDSGAFRLHDALIALRTVQGDLFGALAETEEMTKAGERGNWPDPESERMTLVRLKEHWHRAYLLRMAAQTRTGAARDAFVRYAERAREDYVAAAGTDKDLADSIAVLDAYFAFCAGDKPAMVSAAQRVHVNEDDDVEDLYLVQLALAGGGDEAGAERVRQRMRALHSPNVIAPIFLAWLKSDDATTPRFSPKHPSAAP